MADSVRLVAKSCCLQGARSRVNEILNEEFGRQTSRIKRVVAPLRVHVSLTLVCFVLSVGVWLTMIIAYDGIRDGTCPTCFFNCAPLC